MKKKIVLFVLAVLLLLTLTWIFVSFPNEGSKMSSNASLTKTSSVEEEFNSKEILQIEEKEKLLTDNSTRSEKYKKLDCSNLAEDYPDEQHLFEQYFGELVFKETEITEDGLYSNLSPETLDSYIQSGDTSAMLVKAGNIIWGHFFGIPQYQSNYKEDFQIYINSNYDQVESARQLLYKAALNGKFIAFNEISISYNLEINSLAKKDKLSEEELIKNIKEMILHSRMYELLFKKDSPYIGSRFGTIHRQYSMKNLQAHAKEFDIENVEDTYEQLYKDTDSAFDKLKSKWEQDRASLGLPPYPEQTPDNIKEYLLSVEQQCKKA